MNIEELIALVPPPVDPVEVGSSHEWTRVERELGLHLPLDLRELCQIYGSGSFGKIGIYNPFSATYLDIVKEDLSCYRELKRHEGDESIPYPILPDQPGLLPCGGNDEDGMLFWLTDGFSDSWPLILLDSPFEWQRFDMTITAFLVKLIKHEVICLWWDQEWQAEHLDPITFRPSHL